MAVAVLQLAAAEDLAVRLGHEHPAVVGADDRRDALGVGTPSVQQVRLGGPSDLAGGAAVRRLDQRHQGRHILGGGGAEGRPGGSCGDHATGS